MVLVLAWWLVGWFLKAVSELLPLLVAPVM